MRIKDDSVETKFHPMLTSFLFEADKLYRDWGGELVITSGSEDSTRHSRTSLHYADPCCAADTRIHQYANIPSALDQKHALIDLARDFCAANNIPSDWIEVILESHHMHVEYQPKRKF